MLRLNKLYCAAIVAAVFFTNTDQASANSKIDRCTVLFEGAHQAMPTDDTYEVALIQGGAMIIVKQGMKPYTCLEVPQPWIQMLYYRMENQNPPGEWIGPPAEGGSLDNCLHDGGKF